MDPFLTAFLNIAGDTFGVLLVLGLFAFIGFVIWQLIQAFRN